MKIAKTGNLQKFDPTKVKAYVYDISEDLGVDLSIPVLGYVVCVRVCANLHRRYTVETC